MSLSEAHYWANRELVYRQNVLKVKEWTTRAATLHFGIALPSCVGILMFGSLFILRQWQRHPILVGGNWGSNICWIWWIETRNFSDLFTFLREIALLRQLPFTFSGSQGQLWSSSRHWCILNDKPNLFFGFSSDTEGLDTSSISK